MAGIDCTLPPCTSNFFYGDLKPEQVKKIHMWRLEVNASLPASSGRVVSSRTTRVKSHHFAPYPRRDALSPHTSSTNTAVTTQEHSANTFRISPKLVCQHKGHPLAKYFMGQGPVVYDLPDPEINPVITLSIPEIEEEYQRVLAICSKLEEGKQHAEIRWLRETNHDAMQSLLDAGISVQRAFNAAQYIVDYAHECGLRVDFNRLFVQHYSPPLKLLPSLSLNIPPLNSSYV